MGLGRRIEFAPEHAALCAGGASNRIDVDHFHRRQVDHHAAVVGAIAGRAVSTAAHRYQQAVRVGETYRVLHVADTGAMGDQRRTSINVAIPNAACTFVSAVANQHETAANLVA